MRTRLYNFRKLRRAFTLIELLVVMAILVILLLVALPAFEYITSARGTEAATNVASAMIGRARSLALSRTDGKFIGVLFYNEVEGDRDAMQLVEVDADDNAAVIERYFGWQNSVPYRTAITSGPTQKDPDVVYSQAIDRDIGSNNARFLNKPTVRRFICVQDTSPGQKPPNSNGTAGFFADNFWNTRLDGNMTPVTLDAEVQYLPKGVRARVLKPNGTTVVQPAGVILFDKQGRLANRRWGIGRDNNSALDGGEKLLEAMGIDGDLALSEERRSGTVLAIFADKELADANVDIKKVSDTNDWVAKRATQLAVSAQSGELISGPAQ